jgi:hypothetical protein
MNLNVSQPQSRIPRGPGARTLRSGETHPRLTRVDQQLGALPAGLSPVSAVPLRIERESKENRMRTEGIRATAPGWSRRGEEVRHG